MSTSVQVAENNNKSKKNQRPPKNKRPKDRRYYRSQLNTVKYTILGREVNEGLLFKAFLYVVFISTSYIYLNPIMKMMVDMVMTTGDLIDPTITWIPS